MGKVLKMTQKRSEIKKNRKDMGKSTKNGLKRVAKRQKEGTFTVFFDCFYGSGRPRTGSIGKTWGFLGSFFVFPKSGVIIFRAF